MTDQVYRQAFEQAKADLAAATKRKADAEREMVLADTEMVQLRRTVTALAAVVGENVEDSIGLTEAVRLMFKEDPSWYSLKDVKEGAEALGCSLADLKNPDASVMSVLSRLVASGELQSGKQKMKTQTGAVDVRVWREMPKKEESESSLSDDDIPF